MHQQIAQLHSLYCQYSGRQVRLDCSGAGESLWYAWLKMGFTVEDLKTVIDYLRSGISKGTRNPGCLKFRNLIGDPLAFGDELAEAKAVLRNAIKPKTGRESVLEATGRPAAPKTTVQTPEQILAGMKAKAEFSALGKALGNGRQSP